MKKNNIIASLIYSFLFASGATGLIYEIVWTRMLLLSLGTTMTSVVLVTVTFMIGLALGAIVFGKLSDRVTNTLRLYAILELSIGLTAALTPFLSNQAMFLYQNLFWEFNSGQIIIFVKLIVSSLVILPTSFIMGGTVPVAVKFFRNNLADSLSKDLGKIYAINTAGAVTGTLLAAYILIEQLGLSRSIYFATILNLTIGVVMLFLSQGWHSLKIQKNSDERFKSSRLDSGKLVLVFSAVAISGFCGMAYEIVWVRLLTPIIGTYIYAFAFILALVLSGLAIGGFLYQKFLSRVSRVSLVLGLVEMGIGLAAFLSLMILSLFFPSSVLLMEVLVILPAAILMGMSFPIAANLCRNESESGSFVGKLYTFNTIGALLGPIAAAFLLIPQFGSGPSILVIVGLNVFIGLLLILTSAAEATKTIKGAAFALVAVSLLAILSLKYFKPNFFYPKTLKHQLRVLEQRGIPYRYLEDSTASVLAYMSKDRQQHDLIIDGVGITNLVGETKLMAHLPLLINPEAKSLLAICFGMGTTFRSALTYDISVDAAELVPSVPKVFPMFFMDGSEVLANPKGKIIINDGRNHVFLTKRKYDVITVDPPPPLNSAGTTVLYSQEFYNQAKRVLTPNGLFVQWIFFGSRQEDIKMIMQSFLREFPFVYAFSSPIKIGYFFIGSQHELNFDEKSFARKLEQTPKAMSDLNEWNKMDAGYLMSLYYGDKAALEKIVGDSEAVTDDSPRTEYFFLRHRLSQGQ